MSHVTVQHSIVYSILFCTVLPYIVVGSMMSQSGHTNSNQVQTACATPPTPAGPASCSSAVAPEALQRMLAGPQSLARKFSCVRKAAGSSFFFSIFF